jgi:hypothetical protein
MVCNFSANNPVTLRDIERLLTAVSTENFYVKPEEYRHLTRLGRTQYSILKKSGHLDAGTHPSTLGSKRILIHKNFNIYSQRVEWFGVEKIISEKRGRKARYSKKAKQQETIPAIPIRQGEKQQNSIV